MSLKAPFSLCIVLLVAQIQAHAQGQRDLTPEEANAWKSIESARLTPDGKWFVYRLTTLGKPTQVIVRSMQDKTERRYEAGMGGGQPLKISPSGKWIGFVIAAVLPARSGMALVEVASGRREDFADVQTLTFAGSARAEWVALHAYPKETPKSVETSLGAESAKVKRTCPSKRLYPGYCESGLEPAILTLRELGSARSERLANVEAFAFNPAGTQLAWIDAAGVQLLTLASGKNRLLDAQAGARYRELTWSGKGHGFALMRTRESSNNTAMLVFTQLSGSLKKMIFTPANLPRFPSGYEFSPDAMPAPIGLPYNNREALVWRDDEAGLFFQIRLINRPAARTELMADGTVVLWHGQDARLPSKKEQEALADQKFSYLSFLSLKTGQFVQLADARLPYVYPQRRGRNVLGFDRVTDLLAETRGILRRNYSLVDIDSGAQHRVLRDLRIAYFEVYAPHPKLSPDGTSVVYVDLESGGHYKVYDVASGEHRNLTASLPNAFFERHELKSEVFNRIFLTFPAIQGWTDDGAYVLVSDYFDVWALPLKGGQAKRLTPDGQAKHIQYAYTDLLPRGDEQLTAYVYNYNYLPYQPVSTPIVRLDQPMYFAAKDTQSWQTGLGLYAQGRFEMLQWEDAEMSYQKARQANVFVASRATSVEFPDYHRVDRNWRVSKRLSDANPVQREVRWPPRAQLISYRSPAGPALQAILHRPLGYEAGKAYPTIVTVYEQQDWMLNEYRPPNHQNVGLWTQHGYAVLEASIEPRTGEIARSSAEDVLAGIDAAARTGDIDTGKLGLRGHSFGGSGTGAIATQTSIFKVAFALSGNFDWYSACTSWLYRKSFPYETACASDQPRMGGRWWVQWSAYGKNSPLYSAIALQTPLLLAHGDEDPIVSFSQSVGLFNVVRSLGNRPVVLLQTKGAGHEGINEEGEKMALALFDHFLKGAAAPRWWSQGVSYY